MALLIDMQIIGDSVASRMMCRTLFAKLEPGPLAGFLLSTVEPIVKHETADNFVGEHDPKGNPWAPLSPVTIADRIARGYAEGPIQYRSGEMYGFFNAAKGNINATQIGTALTWPGKPPTDEKLFWKVASAQGGNSVSGAPPRPVLGLSLQDGEKIMMGLFEYVVGTSL